MVFLLLVYIRTDPITLPCSLARVGNNDVWDLVELPKDRNSVGSKWVFKVKTGADGSIECYKARLVAQGFSQQFGMDYEETFCLIVRLESLRTLIALSVQNDLQLHQIDVTTAFLNGELKEEVFTNQPKRFIKKDKSIFTSSREVFMA